MNEKELYVNVIHEYFVLTIPLPSLVIKVFSIPFQNGSVLLVKVALKYLPAQLDRVDVAVQQQVGIQVQCLLIRMKQPMALYASHGILILANGGMIFL